MANNNDGLRATFNEVAELYDQVRPGYPDKLFDDVIALSGIPEGGAILEIGCGTGQATISFARRGYRIHCVELGAEMAAVARHNLRAYPHVTVEVGAFESWSGEPEAFDLALSATAWHWVEQPAGYRKAAAILKPGGALAIFGNQHVRVPEDQGFFDAVQQVYDRETPEISTDEPLLAPDEIPDNSQAIEESGLFTVVGTRRYVWSVEYDTASYLRVLQTYSGHRSLAPATRERLFAGIAAMIGLRPARRIIKGYLTTLAVAQRV